MEVGGLQLVGDTEAPDAAGRLGTFASDAKHAAKAGVRRRFPHWADQREVEGRCVAKGVTMEASRDVRRAPTCAQVGGRVVQRGGGGGGRRGTASGHVAQYNFVQVGARVAAQVQLPAVRQWQQGRIDQASCLLMPADADQGPLSLLLTSGQFAAGNAGTSGRCHNIRSP